MIDISLTMFIPFTTKKMGQFSVHQPGQIFANALSDLYSNHLKNSIRLLRKRVENAAIEEIDVAPLFNEVLKNQGFLPHLSTLNLCYPMLKRLKEMGFEIDAFYYPFENNAPEKQFILGCRKYFPNS